VPNHSEVGAVESTGCVETLIVSASGPPIGSTFWQSKCSGVPPTASTVGGGSDVVVSCVLHFIVHVPLVNIKQDNVDCVCPGVCVFHGVCSS
jgi:hypothetical protein